MADSNGNWLQAALAAYAAYQNQSEHQKAAKQMSGPQTIYQSSTRLPYMNPALEKILPYIMQEANRVYNSRQSFAGGHPGAFDVNSILGLPSTGSTSGPTLSPFGAGLGVGQPDNSPSLGSSEGKYGGGEGIYNDLSSRGNSLDMLTPEQHQATAHELTADDLKKLGKFGVDIAKLGITGLGGGMFSAIGDVGTKIYDALKGKAGHGENKFLASIAERMKPVEMPDPLSHFKPEGVPVANGIPNDKFSVPVDRWSGQRNPYDGTASPWDWGENAYSDNGAHNTGGSWGGGGGQNIWDMFSGAYY